ncbi:hypothetical protein FFLO_01615 [Filobasidium floriforme]|uniref:Uncharacterized protein n=1 Tax=Filobasidium floriforme TaxID=5210 RepID=A0A8K0NSL6_9TREE|nr:uncharacterized protein HD553DRAFT_344912 [Filobasidium floriforme]KAG7562925.1 hypothetical protein FFLO_01615 [Filobasidium floriforme]KAH8080623.1 hypothetical protein HD553DRAFT_344912 [Filobasidium floriforme]
MDRDRSVSSSPDPLGGTPRTSTQSTNPDLARSPTPQSSIDDPHLRPVGNGTNTDSSVQFIHTVAIPPSGDFSQEAEEEEEDSRESPSFEGVKFSSSFGPPLSSIDTPKKMSSSKTEILEDDSSPGRARRLESDRPQAHDQPIRKRRLAPTAASSLHRPGSSSSRNIQSSQIPSTTLASKTDLILSHHETTSVKSQRLPGGKGTQQPRVQASSQAMQHRREPPPRSRSARVEDRLATRTVMPPRGLVLPGATPNIDAPLGKTPYTSSRISKNLGPAEVGSSSSSQRPIQRNINTGAALPPITLSNESSAHHEQEEEEEDSIEALRNTGPIRSSRKDDLRSESRAYIYGLPGSSTLFGSDFSKASLAEDGEDAGGFDLGEEFGVGIGTATGEEGGSEEDKDDSLGCGLTRRRRSGSGGENTSELTRAATSHTKMRNRHRKASARQYLGPDRSFRLDRNYQL